MYRISLGVVITGLTGLLLGANSAQASLLIIDDFLTANPDPTTLVLINNPFDTVNFPTSRSNTATGSVSSILGGEREVLFEMNPASTPFSSGILTIAPNDFGGFSGDKGTLLVNNNTGFISQTTLTWDGIGSSGLNANFLEQDLFRIGVEGVVETASFTLTVEDGDSSSAVTVNGIAASDVGKVDFRFENFTGIDFSQVKSLKLEISGTSDFDLEVGSLSAETVPEPSTILGASLALGLGALFAKKKKYTNQ